MKVVVLDRKTQHFTALTECDHLSAIAIHINATGHDIKWDHFEILASGKTVTSIAKLRRLYLFKN